MTKQIKVDLNRTGFPVTIGEMEIWFDSSLENLRSFFNVEELAQKKLKKAQEKARHIHFPEVIKDIKNIKVETIDTILDLNKEYIAIQYDIIFGDGMFKKIYKKYPDILALEDALEIVSKNIAKRIDEQEKERTGLVEEKKEMYLNKKKQKK